MTIHLPEDLANSIRAEVLSGHFANEDEAVAAAVREYLQRRQSQGTPVGTAAQEPNLQELQLRLFESGIISEIKQPITDLTPYRNRQAVPVQGEPLSETIIRERR